MRGVVSKHPVDCAVFIFPTPFLYLCDLASCRCVFLQSGGVLAGQLTEGAARGELQVQFFSFFVSIILNFRGWR